MTAARRTHLRVLAAILAAAAAGVLLQAIPARAHATFVRSEPPAGVSLAAAPVHVRVWFSEPVEPGFTELTVLDVQGRRVDRGGTRPVPGERAAVSVALAPLEQGVYTVVWRALSAVDGHVTRGSFSLLVGPATAPPPPEPPQQAGPAMPLEAAARWAGYLAGAVLLGLLLLGPLVLEPALRGRRLDLGQEAAARARERRGNGDEHVEDTQGSGEPEVAEGHRTPLGKQVASGATIANRPAIVNCRQIGGGTLAAVGEVW